MMITCVPAGTSRNGTRFSARHASDRPDLVPWFSVRHASTDLTSSDSSADIYEEACK